VINEHLRTKARPQLLWDHRTGQLGLGFRPTNLISAIWMQLADAVSGKATYRPCLSCGRWLRMGRDAARAHRLYCSNACRMRGLRSRQQEARSLRSEGRSIEEITDLLKSDLETISRWVAGSEVADDPGDVVMGD
jgi:hypothetical protein